jgi:hypothetical protein
MGAFMSGPVDASSKASHPIPRSYTSMPTKSLPAADAQRCGISLLYPALKNFFDQEIRPECVGSYRRINGAVMVLNYRYGAYPQEPQKMIDVNIFSVPIDIYVDPGSHHHSTSLLMEDGEMRLQPNAGFGDACHNLVRIEITPIASSNWHGWIAESKYKESKIKKDDCKILSPKYRCVSFLIGYKKMSAEFAGACFPRKRTASLEHGFSYDLFMEMIRSIHFDEE